MYLRAVASKLAEALLFCAFNLTILLASPSFAETALDRSYNLSQAGRLVEAEQILRSELARLGTNQVDSEYSLKLLNNLGAILSNQGRLEEALIVFEDTYHRSARALDFNHNDTLIALGNYVSTLVDLDLVERALRELEDFKQRSKTKDEDPTNATIWATDYQRELAARFGDFEQALNLCKEWKAYSVKLGAEPSSVVALEYTLYCSAYMYSTGQASAAESEIVSAIELVPVVNAENSSIVMSLYHDLSQLRRAQGRIAEAARTLEDSIIAADRAGLLHSTNTGIGSLLTLSEIYFDMEDFRSGRNTSEKAIEVLQSLSGGVGFPQDDPDYLHAYAAFGFSQVIFEDPTLALVPLQYAYNEMFSVSMNALSQFEIAFLYGKALKTHEYFEDAIILLEDLLQAQMQYFGAYSTNLFRTQVEICSAKLAVGFQISDAQECELAMGSPAREDPFHIHSEIELLRSILKSQSVVDAVDLVSDIHDRMNAVFSDEDEHLLSHKLQTLGAALLERLGREQRLNADLHASLSVKLLRILNWIDEAGSPRGLGVGSAAPELVEKQALLYRVRQRLLALSLSSTEYQTKREEITRRHIALGEVYDELSTLDQTSSVFENSETEESEPSNDDIAGSIEHAGTLVLYRLLAGKYYAVVLTTYETTVFPLEIELKELNSLVRSVRPGGASSYFEVGKSASEELSVSAHFLHEAIWQPIASQIHTEDVTILPDGVLSQFPFYLLKRSQDHLEPDWLLFDDIVITYVPRVSDVFSHVGRGSKLERNRTLFAVGDPKLGKCNQELVQSDVGFSDDAVFVLPNFLNCFFRSLPEAQQEVEDISKLFEHDSVDLLIGSEASEAELRRHIRIGSLEQASILVFATHGVSAGELSYVIDPQRLFDKEGFGVGTIGPSAVDIARQTTDMSEDDLSKLEGALVFNYFDRNVPDKYNLSAAGLLLSTYHAGPEVDTFNDGFLASWEIASIPLTADIVILSACNTAPSSQFVDDRQFIGLVSPFLDAGARSVLATHWAVESNASSSVSRSFLQQTLNDGTEPAVALRNALRELHARVDNPYLWAPFFFVVGGR